MYSIAFTTPQTPRVEGRHHRSLLLLFSFPGISFLADWIARAVVIWAHHRQARAIFQGGQEATVLHFRVYISASLAACVL